MKLQLKRSLRVLTSDSLTAQPPSVAQMEFGEIAINYASSDPTIFIKDSNNEIQKLQLLAVPDVTPGTTLDDRYVNVDGDVMTGNLTAPKFLGGVAQVLATAPVTAVEGEQYWDTSDNRLYIYNGSAWVDASPATTNLDDLYYRKAPSDERFVVKTATSNQTINNNVEVSDKIFLNTDGTSVFKGEMTLHADILPAEDNVHSLGSPTKMWKDVYIGPGSLYLNGTRILHEDDSENLVLSADSGQNVIFQPTGDGDLELNPEGTGVVAVKAPLTLYSGYAINSSDGNAIKFANDISVGQITSDIDGGDLVLTGAGTGKVKIIDIAEATQFVKTGGASTEFLKADGSVDTNTYATTQQLATEGSDRTSAISAAISTEVTDRNSAIASAIAQEVIDRNTAIDAVSGTYVDSTGDTMTGLLVLSDHPTLASDDKQAATKKYADDLIAPYNLGQIATNQGEISTLSTTKMAKAGGNFTGNVTVGASDKMKFQTDGVAIFGNNTTGVKVDSTGAITGTKGTNVNYSVDGDGAATFVSVSAASVDTTGNVTIGGDLIVNGTTTTINTTDLDVTDKMIVVGKGQSNAASAGSGITVDGANVEWKYDGNNWQTGVGAGFTGAVYVGGTTELTSSIQLKADGSASFDGKISTSVAPTSDSNLTNKLYVDTTVSDEATARTAAISAEESARTAADTTLQSNIDSEASARTSADTTLQSNIDAEATALANAVTALQGDITTEENARIAADSTLTANLATEVSDRQAAVTAEETARTSADTALSGRIDTLEADPTTQTLLTAESTARSSADTTLQSNIDAEEASRIAADALLLPLAGGNMSGAINLGTSGSVYTSNVSAIAVSQGNSIAYVFDGNNSANQNENFRFANSNAAHYVSFEPLTVTSSLRLWIDTSRSGIDLNVDQGGANVVSFTENNGGSNNDPIGWVELPVTTPFTLTSVGRNSGYGSWMYLGAIEVDGVVISEGATIGGSGDASVLNVDGTATFGGLVSASTAPTSDEHLTNKLYVDNKVADFITVPVLMTSSVPDANSYSEGTLWYNRNDGQLYILLEDADSKQWVEANAPRLSN